MISASEMSVAYFPNRSIDENTEIVRKQHVGFRNYDAGKGEFPVSLRQFAPVPQVSIGVSAREPHSAQEP